MREISVKIWGGTQSAYADADGTVRVYDPVAGYWTTCHTLSARVRARVREESWCPLCGTMHRPGVYGPQGYSCAEAV